jgi:hypothetical protein
VVGEATTLGGESTGSVGFVEVSSVFGAAVAAAAFFRSAPVTGFFVISCAPAVVETTSAMTAARLFKCNRMVLLRMRM